MKSRKVLPPVYFLIYLIAAVGLHWAFPIARIVPEALRLWGVAPLAAGFAVMSWAAMLFKAKGTAIKPFEQSTTLVLGGPYRFTRNPMYLGLVLMLVGVALLLGSLAAFLSPIAMFVTLRGLFIPGEEHMLEQTFGQPYRDYIQRVRRWI